MRQDDDLERKLSQLSQVPFSEDLQRRILYQALEMARNSRQGSPSHGHAWHPRRPRWQSWLAAGVGSVVAATMVFAAWQYGQRGATSFPGLPVKSETAARPLAGTYGLQAADISVGYIGIDKGRGSEQGKLVQAMLTNVGTTPLRPQDLFGVLTFSPIGANAQGASGGPLATADWAAFVGPPAQVILPGQSVSWSFRPIGAPENALGQLDEQPRIVFYRTGLVTPQQADQVWTRPQVEIRNVQAQVLSRWSTGQSLQVNARVTNVSSVRLPLTKTWALVWFAAPSSRTTENRSSLTTEKGASLGLGLDWTRPQVVRFLSTVQPTYGANTLAPGQSAEVSFRLVAGPNTPFQRMNSYVTLIWQPSGHGAGIGN